MPIRLRDREVLATLGDVARLRGFTPEAMIDVVVAEEIARTFGKDASRHLRKVSAEYKRMLWSARFSASEKLKVRRTLRSLRRHPPPLVAEPVA